MKYIVMECNLSYAVVLDEEGRFFNVANRNYEVGQTTTDVIKMREPEMENQQASSDIDQATNPTVFAKTRKMTARRWKYLATAVAACLVIIVASVMNISQGAYASVYMTINPDVRIDINKSETVVGLKGLNKDGETVIEGYNYKKKNVDVVIDELLEISIEKGFLHEGSKVSFSFDGKNDKWVVEKSGAITKHVEEYLNGKVSATVQVEKENHAIKIDPDRKRGKTTEGQGNVGNTDYGDDESEGSGRGTSGNTNYGDTNYQNATSGDTNYGGTGNGGSSGSNSNAGSSGSSGSSNSDYGNSDYGMTDQQKAQEEAQKKAEEEARKKAEEEARKKAEEEEKAREEEEKDSEDGDD